MWHVEWRPILTGFIATRQTTNSVQSPRQLYDFLASVLPNRISKASSSVSSKEPESIDATEFIADVRDGLNKAPMSVRLTPHMLSLIDWERPLEDPLRRQFIPLGSTTKKDHPKLSLDSLNESHDSPIKGLVHRYQDKALFLGSCLGYLARCNSDYHLACSICPVYCRFCTRSYSVGAETDTVSKTRFLPLQKKWETMFQYMEQTPVLCDIVVSGGDTFSLEPDQLTEIGNRLLSIPHVHRIRFATKGLAVCPSRILDPDDSWTDALIQLTYKGRDMGKSVALHTHFNHPAEITWITATAAQKLFRNGVTVRNQTVLLHGVNNDINTMQLLIRQLAKLNIQPVRQSPYSD